MAMSMDEAKRIALDKPSKHSTVTFDCAAMVLEREGEPALRQLAELKAACRRLYTGGIKGVWATVQVGN